MQLRDTRARSPRLGLRAPPPALRLPPPALRLLGSAADHGELVPEWERGPPPGRLLRPRIGVPRWRWQGWVQPVPRRHGGVSGG